MPNYYREGGQLIPLRFVRAMRRINELRQLRADEADGAPVRRKRLTAPTTNDDVPPSRAAMRSWKEATKARHQWAGTPKASATP